MPEVNSSEFVNWAQFFPSEDGKLGEYLKKSGRPINCRLDFRLTRLEELKKAAVVVSELNAAIQKLVYDADGDPVLRVMLARGLFGNAQMTLKYAYAERVIKQKKEKEAAELLAKRKLKVKKPRPVIDLGDVFLEAALLVNVAPLAMMAGKA
jgi:hypothetical protein